MHYRNRSENASQRARLTISGPSLTVTGVDPEGTTGIAEPLAAWCGGQICRPIVLAFGKRIACLICDSCHISRYVSDLIQYSHI